MGAYFRFYPYARVETIIPPFFFGPFFNLPAILFLGFWFVLQFYNGALSLAARGQSCSSPARHHAHRPQPQAAYTSTGPTPSTLPATS